MRRGVEGSFKLVTAIEIGRDVESIRSSGPSPPSKVTREDDARAVDT